MGIQDRIFEFCKIEGISVRQFEIKCGMSNGYVSSIRKGVGIDKVDSILHAFPNLSKYWLLFGEGEIYTDGRDGLENESGSNNMIIDRISQFIDHLKISVRSFETSIGASNGLIRKAINQQTDIHSKLILSIVDNYPQLNTDWLLTGRGEMISNTQVALPSTYGHGIPLIPIDAFAGYGTPAFEDQKIEDYYKVAELKTADFLIRVKGDSMSPKYCSGDIIACKIVHETLFFQWNRIYVIYTKSQGVMVKRVKKSNNDGCILLVSDNPIYDPFDVPLNDVQAFALVIGVIRVE